MADGFSQVLSPARRMSGLGYRVPGLLAWLVVVGAIVGLVQFPHVLSMAAALLALYLTARLIGIVVFTLVGTWRIRKWQARDWAAMPAAHGRLNPADVHHVVIVPSYKEPVSLLERTLHGLAAQHDAARCLTVVLAMEESEPDSAVKAHNLAREFEGSFARVLVTMHPRGLPGEQAGKGSNEAWAARQARHELIERLGMPIDRMTITSCDADTVFDPQYFAALAQLFAADPKRNRRFWQAPIFLHNNIWDVPSPTRLMAVLLSGSHLSRLVSPLARPLPLSTYSLSFRLAEEADFWDPAVISEDWHMYLRCFFAVKGDLSLVPIYLPVKMDAVAGGNLWEALRNRYRQAVRHGWGAEDVGYILEQWGRTPDVPAFRKLRRLVQVAHDHVLQSISWFVIIIGHPLTHISPMTEEWRGVLNYCSTAFTFDLFPFGIAPEHMLTAAPLTCGFLVLMKSSYWVSGVGLVLVWVAVLLRTASPNQPGRLARVAVSTVELALLPVVTFVLDTIPTLYAQTRMLVGLQLTYQATPKRAVVVQDEVVREK